MPPGEFPAGTAELARARGYDPDNPATWPESPSVATPEEPAVVSDPQREEVRELTDPKAMRALAHPVRMELLSLFGYHETLTATQASELLGESPANCAFHLRTLAKYGYLKEAGGGRGRERPWAMASRVMNLSSQQEDPQAALAAEELGRTILDYWLAHAREVYGSAQRQPGWESAAGYSLQYAFLTPAETEDLRTEIGRLIGRYQGRYSDPSLRPQGAAPVEWGVFASPVQEWFRGPGRSRPDPDGSRPGPGADTDSDDRQ